MAKEIKTIGVLTSGGDAPGMNAAIRAVVRTALNKGLKVKGIQKGYNGLLNDEIIDMDKRSVADIIQRGGTVLYTARCMEFMTEEGQKRGAEVCRKHGIDGIVVIGGDGSFRGAQKLAAQGINTIGLPGTIDLDIACTDYTIGFDTAVNTAMEAIDKIRDTSTSHERCSIIEVMGRNAGYIALWCGIANGAEDILLPERYDNDEQALINHIIEGRKKGKKHHLIINAEGIGHSTGMARRIEAATGIETRATILGYMQRGGSPTCKDRMYASIMGAYAVDLLAEGKSNRLVAYKDGKFVDYDIDEALAMTKDINDYEFNISALLLSNAWQKGNLIMITSTSSSQVKHVISLLSKARERKKNKEYVVEGVRMVSEVPADLLVKIYMSERFHSNNPEYVHELVKKQGISSDSIEIVADNVFDRMSQTQTPQGIMAVVRMKDSSISDMLTDNPLLILVENLQDPGNLGTILRMGEGAGVTGVVMSSNTVDIYNPKTIRSTMGSIFRVPFVYVQDFSDAVSQCQNAGIKVYAAHLDGKNTYLGEDYREGTAFLIGNEGNGLTDDITKQADTLIRIPMQGEVESLNAAIACTILTYEAVRQRSV